MKPEDLKAAAGFLRQYAAAVERHLYIHMKSDEAHFAIVDSLELAKTFEEEAIRLNIVEKTKLTQLDPGP